jgi:hypothetical protein
VEVGGCVYFMLLFRQLTRRGYLGKWKMCFLCNELTQPNTFFIHILRDMLCIIYMRFVEICRGIFTLKFERYFYHYFEVTNFVSNVQTTHVTYQKI